MDQWFKNGEFAYMNKNMRAKGFMLKVNTKVEILKSHKLDSEVGHYSYDIKVYNPNIEDYVILYSWVSQFDLRSPNEALEYEKNIEYSNALDDEILRLKKQLGII